MKGDRKITEWLKPVRQGRVALAYAFQRISTRREVAEVGAAVGQFECWPISDDGINLRMDDLVVVTDINHVENW